MGKSVSTSIFQTTSNATDERMAIAEGAAGVNGSNNSVSIQRLDGGIVQSAIDAVMAADVTAHEGYAELLKTTSEFFKDAATAQDKSQNAAMSQLQKITAAAADASGTIDQKTMMVIAALAAAVFVLPKMMRGR